MHGLSISGVFSLTSLVKRLFKLSNLPKAISLLFGNSSLQFAKVTVIDNARLVSTQQSRRVILTLLCSHGNWVGQKLKPVTEIS